MRPFFDSERGATALEFSLLFPAFLTVILFIVEFGQLLWIVNTVNYAVEEAARCGAIDVKSCATTAQIQALASQRAMRLVPASGFTVTSGPVCVSAHYTYPPLGLTFPFRSCHA
ncbi:MAG TPA: TadE/TadG family type IV pilus assembly protein [Magnetospirillum sp.]|jgi:Flp pilus assembly protein TadG|nr:TadE/TadG family type IV pilus assembly protein [Magnetospirillum sp.]